MAENNAHHNFPKQNLNKLLVFESEAQKYSFNYHKIPEKQKLFWWNQKIDGSFVENWKMINR